MRSRLQREVIKAGGLRAFARQHEIDAGQLSKAMADESKPIPPIVLVAIGLRRVVTYRSALED